MPRDGNKPVSLMVPGVQTPAARTRAGRALRKVVGQRVSVARWEAQTRLMYALRHRESRETLRSLRGQHAGERCFIIGNGPSLNRTDLSLLRDEYTFGLNRIYLMFDELGFRTSCLACVNRLVLEQSGHELSEVPVPKFVSLAAAGHVASDAQDLTYLRSTAQPKFSRDVVRDGVWEGATVTYVALQLAHWFGFSSAVLVGVDHSFSTTGPAHHTVVSEGADPNHFRPDYFGPGYRWQLPDFPTSELAYAAARDAFQADGREVVDATVDGKLTIFPKVKLEDLF